jgi:hypothetical protein
MNLWPWLTRLFCDHVAMDLAPVGAASVSTAGEVYMTIELTCPACGYINHRPLDATAAIHEGVER